MLSLVAVALAVPYALGVRDWRCYGIVMLWPPVISAIQTGNVTLWLALAAALAWRFRDRLVPASASVGVALAVKFLLWPLLVWFAATRRLASALLAAGIGLGLLLGSWAVIGFDGLRGYPDLLRRLQDAVGDDAYTLANLLDDLGAPSVVARGAWLLVGLVLLVACAHVARRGDERSGIILALAAALASDAARVAALLRSAGRRHRDRAASPGARLVRPTRHGRSVREAAIPHLFRRRSRWRRRRQRSRSRSARFAPRRS